MSSNTEVDFGEHDLHAGLAGTELDEEQYELGNGILLRRTYAHLFAPFTLAFKRPNPGLPHPGPWTSARGGVSFDVTAELFIPAAFNSRFGSKTNVAATIIFLLRLGINPGITSPMWANVGFSLISERPDDEVQLILHEVERRHILLTVDDPGVPPEAAKWIRERWEVALKLISKHSEFALAVEALDQGQFVQSTALALVSLWAALEALFSPAKAELKFRVSALIASYLEAPGPNRLARQKCVAKLYDKRSGAAHGQPSHDGQHLLDSFNLLREVLIKMIDDGAMPTKDELESNLFGLVAADK